MAAAAANSARGSRFRIVVLDMIDNLNQFLHGDRMGILRYVFQKMETDTEVPRIKVALGFFACLALLLLFNNGANFICDFVGFIYPAYVVIQTIEEGQSPEQVDFRKWFTYWVILNTFHSLEYFLLDLESSAIGFYWLCKFSLIITSFLIHLRELVYYLFIKPFLAKYHVQIDNFLESATPSKDNVIGMLRCITKRGGGVPGAGFKLVKTCLHLYVVIPVKGTPTIILILYAWFWGFRSLCNGLIFLYSAYKSMLSLLTGAQIDRMYWLTFWVVYSGYNIVDYVLGGLPLYYLVKFILLGIYMLKPQVQEGIYILMEKLIQKYKPLSRGNREITEHFVQISLTPPDHSTNVVRIYQIGGRSSGTSSLWNLPANRNNTVDPLEVDLQMSSPLVQSVMELNVQVELIKKAITQKLAQDGPGQSFTSVEALREAIFDLSVCENGGEEGRSFSSENYSQVPMKVIEENQQLKEQGLCKICMLEEVRMVFIPCGHLVCCYRCSFKLSICPICTAEIECSVHAFRS